jgi:hypothetical protein
MRGHLTVLKALVAAGANLEAYDKVSIHLFEHSEIPKLKQ